MKTNFADPKLKVDELKAFAQLYVEHAKIELPADVKTKADFVAFLTKTQDEFGILHQITEENLTLNPDLDVFVGAEVGSYVILSADTVLNAPKEEEKVEQTSDSKAPVDLYHRKKLVLSVENKILNGKIYKNVTTIDATHLLTEEEFIKEVSTTR